MKYLLLTLTLLFIYSCGSTELALKRDNKEDSSMKESNKENISKGKPLTYPTTMVKTVEDNYHGVIVKDDYRWLEEDNTNEVKSWTKEQNEFTKNYLNKDLKEKIAKRYRKLFNYTRYNSVMKKGDYYFYYKNDGLQNQSVFYRTKDLKKEGEVVIDPNKLSKDGTTSLGDIYLTKDANIMAYGVSEGGKDDQTYYIKDIKNNKLYPETLTSMRHSSLAWNGMEGFYYGRFPDPKTVKKGEETFNHKLYYHKLGTQQSEDKLIYEEPEFKKHAFAPAITEDGKYLLIYVWEGTNHNTMIYYKNLKGINGTNPNRMHAKAKIIKLLDKFDASYEIIGNFDNIFYILTDKDAPRKRVVKLNILDKEKKLVEIIKEEKDKIMDGAFISNNSIFVNYMKDVHSEISVFDLNGKHLKDIKLPTVGSAGISGTQNNDKVFVTFTSFLYPGVIYDYDFNTEKLTELFTTELDFNANDFEAKQIFYTSKDGTKIPMFIVHKKGLKLDGNNPTLLYGYGGFNVNLTPWFSTIRLLWMENGGVFAIANLRGGGEYGEEWHKAGMLDKKQNVFDDFIYAAKYLIENKYTNSKKLAIMGGSNGGLLVAAVMTQKPELFGAVICQVPLTDMLRFHKFLVGHYWTVEYGNAEKSKEEFDYIYPYSPYQHVKKVDYPSTMIMTADSDDRVAPLHARKFAAILQNNNTSNNPILLRIESKAGHGHGMSTDQIIDEQSDIYAFLFKVFGMNFNSNDTSVKMKDLEIKKEIAYKDGKRFTGKAIGYNNGVKYLEIKYINGIQEGKMTSWHENGQLSFELNYQNGKANGIAKKYYPNGKIKTEETWKNGIPEGPRVSYYENGQIAEKLNQENGDVTGEVKEWYENGKQKRVFNIPSKGEGTLTLYYPDGNISKTETYKDGKLDGKRVQKYPNGTIQFIENFKSDNLDGEVIYNDENGKETFKGFMKNKVLYSYNKKPYTGKINLYNSKGQKEEILEHKNGLPHGKLLYYFDNGNLMKSISYKNGKKEGLTEEYFINGKKKYSANYQKDKISYSLMSRQKN